MTKYVPVGGTRDWFPEDISQRWWQSYSPFSAWMRARGFECHRPAFPFWSTATGGLIPGEGHRIWRFGGANLANYLKSLPYEDRRVVTLSHGGQVAMLAIAEHGVDVASLITVTMPVRKDMQKTYEAAIPRCGLYTHVYATGLLRDRWQLLGSLMDKGLRYKRTVTIGVTPVHNVGISGIGHSDLVRNPELFGLWQSRGLLDRLSHATRDAA